MSSRVRPRRGTSPSEYSPHYMISTVTSVGFVGHQAQHYSSVVYFTEDDDYHLAAAVLWRIRIAPRRWSWRTPMRRIRHFLGPLGIQLHLKWRYEPWTGSSGMHGEQATLFNADRRVVRVLGRDYRLPEPGRTLILLIEERPTPSKQPRVIQRIVELPAVHHRTSATDDQMDLTVRWAALLREDPEVASFMEAE